MITVFITGCMPSSLRCVQHHYSLIVDDRAKVKLYNKHIADAKVTVCPVTY